MVVRSPQWPPLNTSVRISVLKWSLTPVAKHYIYIFPTQSKYNTFPGLLAFSFLFVNAFNSRGSPQTHPNQGIPTSDNRRLEFNLTKCNYNSKESNSRNLVIYKGGARKYIPWIWIPLSNPRLFLSFSLLKTR